ncbi:hypothetical protein FRC15_003159 [Serendipita sp. 397]|nr:hypothetical protein FRC15_003159 [Serendipita sp. 397]
MKYHTHTYRTNVIYNLNMQDRTKNLKAFAGSQLTRLASSNAVNRAYELAIKAKGAVEQKTPPLSTTNGQPQTWREWAASKIPSRGPSIPGVETVHLFPGWATRRSTNKDAGFTLFLHISGFASSLRPPEQATRSQKAFMAIARRMAALPQLPQEAQASIPSNLPLSPSTQDLLRSHETSEEREAEELQALKAELAEMPPELRPSITNEVEVSISQGEGMSLDQLKRMHANLDLRLQPFWSSSIPNRPVIISIFTDFAQDNEDTIESTSFSPLDKRRHPIFQIQTSTDASGVFSQDISIPFETICTNPEALELAFGHYETEPKLIIQAELAPPLLPVPVEGERVIPKSISSHITIPISNRQVRVISDIDDTIKVADVLSGVKKIFNNVFVKGLEELIVPGMNVFYQKLYARGVRFHYVSNSPYGLLPILTEFFQIAEMPPGSLRLRFYGGRSLFGGLWEPAGERKRNGVEHVLNNFRDSKFFLIGDTGEQDLDLYVDLAKERPDQILGIFLRDVVPLAGPVGQFVEDLIFTEEPQTFNPAIPTSANSSQSTPPRTPSSSSSAQPSTPIKPLPYMPRSRSGTDPRRQQPPPQPPMQLRRSFIDDEFIMPGRDPWYQEPNKMTPVQRRRFELDQKIVRSKDTLPPHIVFRVFRNAEENEEDAFRAIDRAMAEMYSRDS